VGSQAQVNFAQPSAASVSLNRVMGLDPSAIYGQLRANGQVFISNPNGVLFAPGAQVNVGGLVASTLRMGADDFMAGTLRLAGDSTAAVVNRGRIAAASGGSVALVAAQVDNAGEIHTPGGTAALVAGADVTLNFSGGALGYRIDQGALGAQVHAGGLVSAPDGQILLSARSASQLQASAIRVPGQLQANSLSHKGGRIVLEAGLIDHSGSVSASGPLGGGEVSYSATSALVHTGRTEATGAAGGLLQANVRNLIDAGQWDASGTHTGGQVRVQATGSVEQTAAGHWRADGGVQGGQVRVTAVDGAWLSGRASAEGSGAEGRGGVVALTAPTLTLAGAQVSADGQAGGGTVHVGGGWQGRDASLANATTTTVNPASVLSAAARQAGDGGEVVVWSQEATGFGGRIDVSAGAQGGDGGRAEVSSHGRLVYGGQVITQAPRGRPGQLLLDPRNLTIDDSAGNTGVQGTDLTYPGHADGDSHGSGGFLVLSGGNIVVASPSDDRAPAPSPGAAAPAA
jgi:filamentous hemagglutinin family protein